MKNSIVWTVLATLIGSGLGAALANIGWEAYQGWVPESELRRELKLRHTAFIPACQRPSPLDGVRVLSVIQEHEKPVSRRFIGIETNQLVALYADKRPVAEGFALMRASSEFRAIIAHRKISGLKESVTEYNDSDLYYCMGELLEYFDIDRGETCNNSKAHENCEIGF